MKKLPRFPMRPEKESEAEVEIWQPNWKCFCCHDSGIVVSHLAAMVIEEFDFKRDKPPRCQILAVIRVATGTVTVLPSAWTIA
jgi:ABC-type proline/glycine betaine transport system substrate-binding protein